jgi:hypothetical protein
VLTVKALNALMDQIKVHCLATPLAGDVFERAICDKIERKPVRDFEAYRNAGLHRAEMSTRWRMSW